MSGVTKSGRIVKKSAKMIEMELIDDFDNFKNITKRKKNKVTEKISSDSSLYVGMFPENIIDELSLISSNIKKNNVAIIGDLVKANYFFGGNTSSHDRVIGYKTASDNETYVTTYGSLKSRKVTKQRDRKLDVRKISAAFLEWSKSQTRNMIKEHRDCDMKLFKIYLNGFWRCISAKEKMRWHRKAQKGGERISKESDQDVENNFFQKTLLDPIDIAALLSLVGDSLVNIGTKLQEHKGKIALEGNLSLLLNSILSSLSLLMALTISFPMLHGTPQDVHLDTIDKVKGFFESG